jgi:trehalose 6-phosphate phosphatase
VLEPHDFPLLILGALKTSTSYHGPMPSTYGTDFAPPTLHSQQHCIFLDFDGTLVEIVQRPSDVVVDQLLSILLTRLQCRLDGRLAVVSGRSIAQLMGFFGTTADGLTLVGSHGAEIQLAGQLIETPFRPDALKDAEIMFRKFFSNNPNIVIEVKSFGLAIHYRLDPAMELVATKMASAFAKENGLALQKGKMMVELRTTGHDKGTAINTLLSAAPFAGYSPVFIGDDLTDEPGFEVCAAEGGFGILVGPPRDTAACYRLDNVTAVLNWLGQI